MKRVAASTALGRLELALSDPGDAAAARELAAAHGASPDRVAHKLRFAGRDAWLKAGVLRGRARARHACARAFLRAPPPRVREALNFEWLGAHGFQAPAPLAAGWLGGAAPRWQFLVCTFVDGAPLDRALRGSGESDRAGLLAELARETARLHALRFVHRDLYLRNVLALAPGAPRRLVFIDAWRGGERLQARGPAYDLACLFLDGPGILRAAEMRAWLADYAAEREARGAPIEAAQLWSAANRERRALLERVRREPGRWRADEPAVQEFDFAAAAR